MKLRRKKLLAIILATAICMSNMMGTSVSRAATESDNEETIYAEDENVIKEDYDDVSFDYGDIENIWNAKIVSHYDNVYVIKNAGWNQNINASGQVTFGFTAKFDGHKPEEPCSVDMQRVLERVFDNCNIEFKQFTKYD